MFKTMVFPFEANRLCPESAETVVEAVKRYGTALTFIELINTQSEGVKRYEDLKNNWFKKMQAKSDGSGMKLRYLIRKGDFPSTISNIAKEIKAELIVMKLSNAVGHKYQIPLANNVLEISSCPVLLVP